jgi:hypothetical protein
VDAESLIKSSLTPGDENGISNRRRV